MNTALSYLQGLGNYFESEALPGTLIRGHNSPQKVPHGLYAEQINGTAFTLPRSHNLHTWLYRLHPSVGHSEFSLRPHERLLSAPFSSEFTPPTQMRWNPLSFPSQPHHFLEGWVTLAGNGSVQSQQGGAIHLYTATHSMEKEYFYNADGELLILPQEGVLLLKTELGFIQLSPGEVGVIPRGIVFQIILETPQARGYICENYGIPFRLPDLGVLGPNCLARARDFQLPKAAYENQAGNYTLIAKFQGRLWQASLPHSPCNVVAWHGNYLPYKYDLSLFNTINTVSFDHPDPSIFTVLTSPSSLPEIANIDFVIFPSRWMVAKNTFRPPYYHRNVMSEYMGLIHGAYDAKPSGFQPGGGSLHNCMSAHGPDANAYQQAIQQPLQPEYYQNTLAFMLESSQAWYLTPQAHDKHWLQNDYLHCWKDLPKLLLL